MNDPTQEYVDRVKDVYNSKMLGRGCSLVDGKIFPPNGMGEFGYRELSDTCLKEAQNEVQVPGEPIKGPTGPYWDEFNPWKDGLVYVPLEELAQCLMTAAYGNEVDSALKTWRHMSSHLDGYILVNTLSAGIRYGSEGSQYLSPQFSMPKIAALLKKYRR